jgi:hypothetical protein
MRSVQKKSRVPFLSLGMRGSNTVLIAEQVKMRAVQKKSRVPFLFLSFFRARP